MHFLYLHKLKELAFCKQENIFFGLFFVAVFIMGFVMITPVSYAETTPVFSGGGLQSGLDAIDEDMRSDLGVIESESIVDTIFFLIRYALIIAGIAAFVAFVWAGLLYVTSFLNEENNETAKKVMMYAAIGIVLILLSYAIVSFLITLEL